MIESVDAEVASCSERRDGWLPVRVHHRVDEIGCCGKRYLSVARNTPNSKSPVTSSSVESFSAVT